MFYLSPCNSFYILGLCSLASVQSQPRDTGLYQAHMCALLQLTHISSFVTVTKLARLSWEMCRLWLTAHVWILYFESHADLSNTGSVKASLTLLSSTGTREGAAEGSQLWPHVSELPYTLYVCMWSRDWILSHTPLFHSVTFTKTKSQKHVPGMFLLLLSRENPRGKTKWNIFHACILARLPVREKKKEKKKLSCIPWSDQSLKLHRESFSNNSLILGLQRSVDVCCRRRKSVKSVPCDANSLKYCFHNCAS